MNISNNTLAQIVSMKPATAAVFESHDLDYCCRGKQTLKEACGDNAVKLQTIEQELEEILFFNPNKSGHHFTDMPLDELVDYIIQKHHRYVKEFIPGIRAHLSKVNSKHGIRHPELNEIKTLFDQIADEMIMHMSKEEHILFPRIKEVSKCAKEKMLNRLHDRQFIAGPVRAMESEHENAGSILHQIRTLTHNYTPPQDACMTFQVVYHELKEFETDLHQHVHLENNILFPKAIELFNYPDEVSVN